MMTMSIKDIRNAIIDRLRTNQSTADLQEQLALEHAKEAAKAEIPHLQKIADQRAEMERRAAALQVRVQVHETHLDTFLALRDGILPILKEAMAKSKPLIEAESAIYEGEGFADLMQFMAAAGDIPSGYLPPNLTCHFLEMTSPGISASGQGHEAMAHLQAALGILGAIQKAPVAMPPLKSIDEGL